MVMLVKYEDGEIRDVMDVIKQLQNICKKQRAEIKELKQQANIFEKLIQS